MSQETVDVLNVLQTAQLPRATQVQTGTPTAPRTNSINASLNDNKNANLLACDGTVDFVLAGADTVGGATGLILGFGNYCKITAWGRSANNANAKDVRLRIGGVDVLTLALTANIVCPWRIEGMIMIRNAGANAQQSYDVWGMQNGAIVQAAVVQNLSVPAGFTINVRTSAAAGDVSADGVMSEIALT